MNSSIQSVDDVDLISRYQWIDMMVVNTKNVICGNNRQIE